MGNRAEQPSTGQAKLAGAKRSRIFVYGFAVVVAVLTLLVRLSIYPWVGDRPLLVIFFIPILFSAYIGGLGPGLVATVIAAIGADYFLFPPTHSLLFDKPMDCLQWFVFTASGVLASVLNEALLRARRRADINRTLYAVTLASIGDAVITTDEYGRVTFLNGEAERLTGWKHSDAVGQTLPSIFRIINEQTRETVEDPVKKVFRTGAVVGLANHTVLISRDGREVIIDDSGAPIRQADGRIIGVVLVFRDNTEKKRAEDALRESQSLYHSLVDQMPAGVFRKDAEGRYVFINSSFCQLKGMKPEQFLGKTALELGLEDATLAVSGASHHEQIMKTGRSIEVEEKYLRADGEALYFQVVKSPVFDSGGKVVGSQGILIDVTARRDAEAAARESQMLYRSLVDQLPAGIFRKDVEGRYVFVNRFFCRLRNTTAKDFLGKLPGELSASEDPFKRQAADHHAQIMQTGRSIEVLDEYHRMDGKLLYFQVLKSPVFDANGKIIGSQGILFDITGRKDAETATLESQSHYHSLVDQMPAGIFRKDAAGRYVFVNSWFCRLKGIEPEAMLGKTPPELARDELAGHQPENPAIARETQLAIQGEDHHQTIMRTGRPIEVEEEYPGPDGTKLHLHVVKTPVFDASGKVVGSQGVLFDVTERKFAEEQVYESERKYRELVENANSVIVRWTSEGRVTFLNEFGQKFFGYSADEILGRHVVGTIVPDTETGGRDLRPLIEQITTNPKSFEQSVNENICRDGRRVWIAWTNKTVLDEQGKLKEILSIGSDITERKRLEEQLRQSQKMDAIGKLAGGVAHDFNNLLTVIQGNASLALSQGISPEAGAECGRQILKAAERAAGLTRQLLLFSRKQTLQPVDLDLNEVVTNIAKMLQRILGEDIQLQFKFAAQPLFIHADASMMDQTLLNLAVNSRDAMPKGGRLIIETSIAKFDATITKQSAHARPGTFVCLSVSDNGCGIPPEILPRIFEPFFTTKDVGKGTGLGLATVFGVVQQHQGWVNVYSEVGQGTTFRIYLPRLAKIDGAKSAQPTLDSLPRGRETILLVEDESAVRNLVQLLLTRLGYHVIEADTGVKALQVWKQNHKNIRLLLTDLVMPDGMNGKDLAKQLLSENPRLKVIYTSGYSAEIAGEDFQLVEGVNFLPKPFEVHKLAQTVRDKLDGKIAG